MTFFNGPVPVASIEEIISFLDGATPVSFPVLYADVLSVVGWATGQSLSQHLLHTVAYKTVFATKPELKKVLMDVVAGATTIDWLALLQDLLALLPSILPFLKPAPV